jgi:hypothetical protein
MSKFSKLYNRNEKKFGRENKKKMKEIGDDLNGQARFIFGKYAEALGNMAPFVKICAGPEDQKEYILKLTASLKEAIEVFSASFSTDAEP